MSDVTPSNVVQLPPGTQVSAGYESSQVNAAGQSVPGMVYTVTMNNGTSTKVFVPYVLSSNLPVVSEMIAERIRSIQGVEGLST